MSWPTRERRTVYENRWITVTEDDVVRIADTAGLTGSRTVATAVVLLDRALGLIALFAVAASWISSRTSRTVGPMEAASSAIHAALTWSQLSGS